MADDTSALRYVTIIDTAIRTVLKMLLVPLTVDVIHSKITGIDITKVVWCGSASSESKLTNNKI